MTAPTPPSRQPAPDDAARIPHMQADEPAARQERLSFDRDELAMVMSHYDIGVIESIRPLLRGSRQAPKLVIRTPQESYLLKKRAPGRDQPQRVAFTHSLMVHLYEQGYPIPRLVGTRLDNNSMLQLDTSVYEMFTFVDGSRYLRDTKSARHAGIALGHMHRLLEQFTSPFSFPTGGYHDFPEFEKRLDATPAAVQAREPEVDMAALGARIDRLRSRFIDARDRATMLGYANFPSGIGHGDWHPGNVLFRGAAVAAVIDFDSARAEPCASDVANGILQFTMQIGTSRDPDNWPIGLELPLLRSFWAGYDDMCGAKVDGSVRAAIPWLIIEALIVESVLPISTTGSFGRIPGSAFLRIIDDQVEWVLAHADAINAGLERTS
ncbi:MAG: phosphotransferase [Planctomycetota bacterium]